jgi:quercetin dioxygenase-like cupin family protein
MFPTAKKNQDFAMQQELQVEHHFSSGVYAKRMILKAGASINSHKHKFDHMSILGQGIAKVTVDDASETYYAPAVIEIKADKTHRVEAITECHWYCIHATDITDPDLIDETLIAEAQNAI